MDLSIKQHIVIEEDLECIAHTGLPWEQFEGKTVLISGANVFLPAYMVETLLYLNEHRLIKPAQVVGLVRNEAKAHARFAVYAERTDLRFLVQNVIDPVQLEEPVHYIIHAASQASPKYYGVDPVGTLLANVLGTYQLLALAQAKQIQGFLFFSSSEVYGQVPEDQISVHETAYGYLDPTNVRACYAESKRMGETMCVAWSQQFGVPTKIARPFHTYGPGMDLEDGRVFADFVADIVHNRDIIMKSDGSAIRAFCYLADATVGFFTVLLKGETGKAYNIANDKAVTSILNLAELLVDLFPEKALQVIKQGTNVPGYLKSGINVSYPNITRARELGWDPRVSLAEGFNRTVRSYS